MIRRQVPSYHQLMVAIRLSVPYTFQALSHGNLHTNRDQPPAFLTHFLDAMSTPQEEPLRLL